MTREWWLALLGALLIGYLVLDGATSGVALVRLHLARDEDERRLLLNVVGPFFLGSEVWIVATVGLLAGAFPLLEGSLLGGFYPLIVLVVGGLIVRDGAMWFRSRHESARWRARWDIVLAVACGGLTFGWGVVLGNLVLGNLVQRVPSGHGAGPSVAALFDPYAVLSGVTFVLLTAAHGATFVALRRPGPVGARAARTARWLGGPGAVGLVAVVGFGVAAGQLDRPVTAVVAGAAAVLALLAGRRLVTVGRPGWAFAASGAAIALPVLAVGAGQSPTLLAMIAPSASLNLLGAFLVVVLPVLAAAQVWLWRAFRGPVDAGSPRYF